MTGAIRKHLKILEKSLTVPKKIEMGDLLVSFDFVCYIKKGKHERTLCTNLDAFPLAGLGRCSSLVVLVVSVKSGPFSVR